MANTCHASHPTFQIGWEQWKCPHCGGDMYVDWRATDACPECKRLHSDDQIACRQCLFVCYGNSFAKLHLTRGHNTPCHCCSGRGYLYNKRPDQRTKKPKEKT